jgi:hypothetical protein
VLILTGQIEATPEAAKVAQYTLIRKMREGIGGVDELVDAFIEARESYQPGDGWDPRTPA